MLVHVQNKILAHDGQSNQGDIGFSTHHSTSRQKIIEPLVKVLVLFHCFVWGNRLLSARRLSSGYRTGWAWGGVIFCWCSPMTYGWDMLTERLVERLWIMLLLLRLLLQEWIANRAATRSLCAPITCVCACLYDHWWLMMMTALGLNAKVNSLEFVQFSFDDSGRFMRFPSILTDNFWMHKMRSYWSTAFRVNLASI